MAKYDLYWSPEGRVIATVEATSAREARKKIPKPYKKFPGEVYVQRRPATDRR